MHLSTPRFSSHSPDSLRFDPHIIVPRTEADDREDAKRLAAEIPRFDAVYAKSSGSPYAGYVDGVAYLDTKSRYQQWMRREMGPNDNVTYHYTAKQSAKVVERYVVYRVQPVDMTYS